MFFRCETWCDEGSKSSAKTIDLCNNPQTKEPKLDSAMRIIPEWIGYDNEIRNLLTKKVVQPDDPKQPKGDLKKDETHSEL